MPWPESDWKQAAEDAGWLSPEKLTALTQELEAAQSCLPTAEGIEKFLEAAVPTSLASDIDNVESGLELQEALVGVRDALTAARALLPKVQPPPEPVSAEKTTVHILREGLTLCQFTTVLPRFWPSNQKWAHSAEELRRLKPPEHACMDCVRKDQLNRQRPK